MVEKWERGGKGQNVVLFLGKKAQLRASSGPAQEKMKALQ